MTLERFDQCAEPVQTVFGVLVVYATAANGERWAEIGVTPSLDKLLGSVPSLKKAVASPISASWNQLRGWLRAVDGFRRAA